MIYSILSYLANIFLYMMVVGGAGFIMCMIIALIFFYHEIIPKKPNVTIRSLTHECTDIFEEDKTGHGKHWHPCKWHAPTKQTVVLTNPPE